MSELMLKIYVIISVCGFLRVRCQKSSLKFNPEGFEFVKHINESLYITCFHENATDIWWYKDGIQPINEAFTRVYVERGNFFSFQGAALVFTSIQSSDRGNYTCKAKVFNKPESLSFLLITYKPITFRDTPPIQSFEEFAPGVIRCDAEGEPEPGISWFVNGKQVEGNLRYKPIADGLLISNVTLEDAKQEFVCRAAAVNNVTSNIEVKHIKLNVLYSPKVKSRRSSLLHGYIGGQINITCEVDSNPVANLSWLRNNTKYSENFNSTIFYGKNKSILRINYITSLDFGEYRCKAANEKGSVSIVFLLKQLHKPEPPKKAKIHSTTHNSLQLEIHGPPTRENETIGYRVQIMENTEKEKAKRWEVAREVILPIGKPFVINDLKPDTEYVVRVTSQNEAGSGEFTKEIKTKTLASASGSHSISFSKAIRLLVLFSLLIFLL